MIVSAGFVYGLVLVVVGVVALIVSLRAIKQEFDARRWSIVYAGNVTLWRIERRSAMRRTVIGLASLTVLMMIAGLPLLEVLFPVAPFPDGYAVAVIMAVVVGGIVLLFSVCTFIFLLYHRIAMRNEARKKYTLRPPADAAASVPDGSHERIP